MKPADVAYVVALECLLCGRHITEVQLPSMGAPIPLRTLEQRCRVCGGQSVRGGDADRVYVGPPIVMKDDGRVRRGRPPKWLLALRAQELAALA